MLSAVGITSPPYWGLRDYGVAGQIGGLTRNERNGMAIQRAALLVLLAIGSGGKDTLILDLTRARTPTEQTGRFPGGSGSSYSVNTPY